MGKFHYLKVGLSLVLVFVGAKMLVAGAYKIPILASLAVIAVLLGGSILISLLRRPAKPLPAIHPSHGGPPSTVAKAEESMTNKPKLP